MGFGMARFLANRFEDSWADRPGGLSVSGDSAVPGPGSKCRARAPDPHAAKDPKDSKDQRDENTAWFWGLPVSRLLSRHSCLLPTEAWMPNSAAIPSFWSLLSFWSLFTRGFRQAPQSASKDAALWWDAGSGGLSPTWGRHSCLPSGSQTRMSAPPSSYTIHPQGFPASASSPAVPPASPLARTAARPRTLSRIFSRYPDHNAVTLQSPWRRETPPSPLTTPEAARHSACRQRPAARANTPPEARTRQPPRGEWDRNTSLR